MCLCNPKVRTPWCPNCIGFMDARSTLTNKPKIIKHFERVKEIVKLMNGLSDEGFRNRYMNDPAFHKGVDVLADISYRNGKDDE